MAISPTVTLSSNATTIAEDGTAIITATLDYASTTETVVLFDPSGTATRGTDFKGKNITEYAIGATHQAGLIFYLDGSGGGLVAAPSDQSSGAIWGCAGSTTGADGRAVGTGYQNTLDIEAVCATSGTAADICANLSLGDFTDWFLPSRDEQDLMRQNIGQGNAGGLGNVGGFAVDYYWSSTENDYYNAWFQNFANGYQYNFNKANDGNVRAVRAF